MHGPIRQLSGEHFDEAIQFLDRVFGEYRPHDFANMLPAVYQPVDAAMRNNYALFDRDRIIALVGLFPIKYRLGDVTLRLAGVGGVSVEKAHRGQGHMHYLMSYVRDEIRRQGFDLSYLWGSRLRYQRFGWEEAGGDVHLQMTPDSVRAVPCSVAGLSFTSLPRERSAQAVVDSSLIRALKGYHRALPVGCVRSDAAFVPTLQAWHYEPWVTLTQQGQPVGYLVFDPTEERVVELAAGDAELAASMVQSWVLKCNRPIQLIEPALPTERLARLRRIAVSERLSNSGNWQLFNYSRVLDAALRLRHRTQPLPEGRVVVQVEGRPNALLLEVRERSAGCSVTDATPDLRWDAFRLLRFLFGPEHVPRAELPEAAALLSDWCPLPLSMPSQDRV